MPTATTAGQLSLTNAGSLTTTFTAPSSCATVPGYIRSGAGNGNFGIGVIQAVDNCDEDNFPKECYPNGDEISKMMDSLEPEELISVLTYYSPGIHCPDSWATVGVYAPGQHSNNSTTSAAEDLGIFSPTAFNNGRPGESTSFPYADFIANMFTSALASTETAVVCCPSGFSVDPFAGCYSNFPLTSLADKSGCIRSVTGGRGFTQERFTYTYEFWGDTTTITPYSRVLAPGTDEGTRVTITFDESGVPLEDGMSSRPTGDAATNLQGVAAIAPMYLVHADGDGGGSDENENEDGDDEDEDENGDEGDEDGEDGDEDNDDSAAERLSPIAGVLAVWGFSVAAGLGLLITW